MFACDISYYQPVVDDSYPHPWLIFRGCDGDFIDSNASANLAWAARNLGHRLQGFTVYVVYRPGLNSAILANLDALHVPSTAHVMVDCESWGGAIGGDHSAELNALVAALAHRQGGQDKVWGYGNTFDLAQIWPGRPKWLGLVVAAYGSQKPNLSPLIGWQYYGATTDPVSPGYPTSSAPFGACDHNELYVQHPAPTPVPEEDEMANYPYIIYDKSNPANAAVVDVCGVSLLRDGDSVQGMRAVLHCVSVPLGSATFKARIAGAK